MFLSHLVLIRQINIFRTREYLKSHIRAYITDAFSVFDARFQFWMRYWFTILVIIGWYFNHILFENILYHIQKRGIQKFFDYTHINVSKQQCEPLLSRKQISLGKYTHEFYICGWTIKIYSLKERNSFLVSFRVIKECDNLRIKIFMAFYILHKLYWMLTNSVLDLLIFRNIFSIALLYKRKYFLSNYMIVCENIWKAITLLRILVLSRFPIAVL